MYKFTHCCISFDSYIKPQPLEVALRILCVVYLLIPTSNHNLQLHLSQQSSVVYLLIPTSNHNFVVVNPIYRQLYIF